MESKTENKPISFIGSLTVEKVRELEGYQESSYSHTTYGINKVVTQYVLVTEDMLSNVNKRDSD